ncbi:sensor histidine kinase, partial [Bacteroidota bacterium]
PHSVFDLRDVINEVFDQFEEKADKKELQLGFSDNSLIIAMVYGDRQKISQVILNIISNAIKYSHDKDSRIIVELKDLEDFINVSVKDNGMGIPPGDINRIFERFYRVDKSRSKDTGGTGLGLSIVKHILEAHNQSVSVESAVGEGSIFTFKLPKAGKVSEESESESNIS